MPTREHNCYKFIFVHYTMYTSHHVLTYKNFLFLTETCFFNCVFFFCHLTSSLSKSENVHFIYYDHRFKIFINFILPLTCTHSLTKRKKILTSYKNNKNEKIVRYFLKWTEQLHKVYETLE